MSLDTLSLSVDLPLILHSAALFVHPIPSLAAFPSINAIVKGHSSLSLIIWAKKVVLHLCILFMSDHDVSPSHTMQFVAFFSDIMILLP